LNIRPALLPEREIHAVPVPAVSPQANFQRASGAEERSERVLNPLISDFRKEN
jgi:hypothetical protein